ncbi:hypothetical protein KFE25_008028 [Diacronema lutheri]|uniref:Methyltransferase small domain-containing protein n=1 Tax=Diacronema lutheri TaxID=2081491 RepID=A0A8J5XN50_DIALT|nr:hypothetical protein KFE25_008028 [Diacronema lutheri]
MTRNEEVSQRLSGARSASALADIVAASPLNGYNLAHALHCAQALTPASGDGQQRSGAFARALAPLLEQLSATEGALKLGPKHISKAVWAASKLGRLADVAALPPFAAAVRALWTRLGALAPSIDSQALTNSLYALALSEAEPSDALLSALLDAVRARAPALNSRDVATFVRSRARVLALLARARARGEVGAGAHGAALASAEELAQAELLALVLSDGATGRKVGAMDAPDVGDLAWALGRLAAPTAALGGPTAVELSRAAESLALRAASLAGTLDWQALGHLGYFARQAREHALIGDARAAELEDALCPGCARALRLGGGARALVDPAELLLREAPALLDATPARAGLRACARVLVFASGRVCRDLPRLPALRHLALSTRHWRRFARKRRRGRLWPPPARAHADGAGARAGENEKDDLYDACVMRMSALDASFRLALHGAACALRVGAPLLVFGRAEEGALQHGLHSLRAAAGAAVAGAAERGRALFADVRIVAEHGGAVVLGATRALALARASARCAEWREVVAITLPAAPPSPPPGSRDAGWGARADSAPTSAEPTPWCVLPGLFAGGELDVMTRFLLEQMPAPPRGAAILDVGSGSGTIGAALASRAERVQLTLLDADAVALEAARRNVPTARALVCSDRFCALPARARGSFDLVVSNPPVHARNGIEQDFRVLRAIVRHAPRLLRQVDGAGGRRAGVLWIVTQQYVPCGLLLRARGAFARVDARFSPDGRFVVWRAAMGEERDTARARGAGACGRKRAADGFGVDAGPRKRPRD